MRKRPSSHSLLIRCLTEPGLMPAQAAQRMASAQLCSSAVCRGYAGPWHKSTEHLNLRGCITKTQGTKVLQQAASTKQQYSEKPKPCHRGAFPVTTQNQALHFQRMPQTFPGAQTTAEMTELLQHCLSLTPSWNCCKNTNRTLHLLQN